MTRLLLCVVTVAVVACGKKEETDSPNALRADLFIQEIAASPPTCTSTATSRGPGATLRARRRKMRHA